MEILLQIPSLYHEKLIFAPAPISHQIALLVAGVKSKTTLDLDPIDLLLNVGLPRSYLRWNQSTPKLHLATCQLVRQEVLDVNLAGYIHE